MELTHDLEINTLLSSDKRFKYNNLPLQPDHTLLATIKVLLDKRYEGDFAVESGRMGYGGTDSLAGVIYRNNLDTDTNYNLRLIELGRPEEFDSIVPYKQNEEGRIEVLEDVNLFAKQHGKKLVAVKCHDTVFVFTPRHKMESIWHLVQAMFPAMFKDIFKDKPLDDLESKLLASLLEPTSVNYRLIMEKIVSERGYRENFLHSQLYGIEASLVQTRTQSIRDRISDIEATIKDHLKSIVLKERQIEELEAQVRGMIMKEPDLSLYNYFKSTKTVEFKSYDRSMNVIRYVVKTYLDNFNPDLYETMTDKSSLFREAMDDYGVSFEDAKILYDAIFKEESVKVRMFASLILYLADQSGRAIGYSNNYMSDDSRMPNPHLYFHNCFGNNAPEMSLAVAKGDYAMAIALSISSAGNLNLGDGYVVPEFAQLLFDENRKAIEFPDGMIANAYEAIERLKGESK